MTTERGLDRVVFFTDAVVAIAITLLILPLVDAVPEAASEGTRVIDFLVDNASQLLGFAISFAVTARLWSAHHVIFQHVRAHSPMLVQLSLFWAFTISILPLPTALIAQFNDERTAVAFYIGTMAMSSATLTAISILIYRNARINDPDFPLTRVQLTASASTTGLFVVALAVGVITVSLLPILLLLLASPLIRVLTRGARRTPAKPVG
ncbi:MAG: hypothetical protein JWQ43_2761 [Glaciihabitans sp.]|nr:hypothetical protein [Glaciihabitans sp.]